MVKSNKIQKRENEIFLEQLNDYFTNGIGTNVEKLQDFSKYAPRQNLTKFLAKYELFKKILDVEGSIVECGVRFGGGNGLCSNECYF